MRLRAAKKKAPQGAFFVSTGCASRVISELTRIGNATNLASPTLVIHLKYQVFCNNVVLEINPDGKPF